MIKRVLIEALRAMKGGDYAIAELNLVEALKLLELAEDGKEKFWCWP